MKRKILLLLFLGMASLGFPQFVTMPLDFPGYNYHPWFLDAVDSSTVWVGANYVTSAGYLNYSEAIKSTDAGNTWNFYHIPETGVVTIFDVCAVDANQCYYVTYNGVPAIWRTLDGGSSWVNTTPAQFVGGWANFYYAATPDTGIAGGDPTDGYWEIRHTTDGGDTWDRVPSANIPPPVNQEYGISHGYSVYGNNIWFSTSKGRCFRSVDNGYHWIVSQVPGEWTHPLVCFIDSLRGVYYDQSPYFPYFKSSYPPYNIYYMTVDGGLTWTEKSIGTNYFFRNFSTIPGIEEGMVVGAYDSTQNYSVSVFFTYDFMENLFMVQSGISSSGEMNFTSNTNGWLSGPGTQTDNIFKFRGDLWSFTGIPETAGNQLDVDIYPNPAYNSLTIELPSPSGHAQLMVVNIKGQQLINRPLNSQKTEIDVSGLPTGLYFIKVVDDRGVFVKKMVKK